MGKPTIKITNCRIHRIDPDKPWVITEGDVELDVSGVIENGE